MGLKDEKLKKEMIEFLPKLRSFARGLTGDISLADDLVQNVCERALIKLHQFSIGTRLDSWMYRIACTQWYDQLRKKKRRSESLIKLSDYSNSFKKEQIINNTASESSLDIRDALRKLPDDQRIALTLVNIAGYNYDEVSKILDIPVGTVASRVARSRMKMVEILSAKKPENSNNTTIDGYGHGKTR